jgi:hypothetical protein
MLSESALRTAMSTELWPRVQYTFRDASAMPTEMVIFLTVTLHFRVEIKLIINHLGFYEEVDDK